MRQLRENRLADANQITRVAFGTFTGLADPASFMGDAGYVRTRWKVDPSSAFAAEIDNEIVRSNFATNWGSVGFFGPLTIRPDLWDKGFGKRLMEPIMECFDRWRTRHVGLLRLAAPSPQAPWFVSEVRVLPPLPHRTLVQASRGERARLNVDEVLGQWRRGFARCLP